MAAEDSLAYSAAWLYSLALLCEVDPARLKLSDKQVEIAFKLSKAWKQAGKRAERPAGAAAGPGGAGAESTEQATHAAEGNKEGGEPAPIEWEDQLEPLEDDLEQVLQRFQQGLLTLDARSIMESLPLWEGVKQKAEENNYRADATGKLDRCLKSVQQKVLGLQRVYPALHSGLDSDGDLVSLGQQFWALLLELENFILQQRKSNSIPGSIQKTTQVLSPRMTSNCLKNKLQSTRRMVTVAT